MNLLWVNNDIKMTLSMMTRMIKIQKEVSNEDEETSKALFCGMLIIIL